MTEACVRTYSVEKCKPRHDETKPAVRVAVSALLYLLFFLRTTTTILQYNLNINYGNQIVVRKSKLYLGSTTQP